MFDPYNVAARFGARYQLNDSQEQILRAFLAGLPDEVVARFEGKTRSLNTVAKHRETMLEQFSDLDRLHFYLVVWRNRRLRNKELRSRAVHEVLRKPEAK